MKKKVCLILSVLLLCMSMTFQSFAAGDRLIDDADLLSESEEVELQAALDTISEAHQMDVVVVTVNSLEGQSVMAFADDYYDYNGYRADGILLLVSMGEREWHMTTAGYGITVFTDAGLEYLENQFLNDLSDGYYYDAFASYAEACEKLIIQAENGAPYDVGNMPRPPFPFARNLLISAVIGLIAALIVTGIWRGQLKSVRPQYAAAEYVKPGSMQVTQRSDFYLYRHVSRQRRAEDSDSGGSTTHRSSSGSSHGGRSGKF